jgi:predicted RNA-binding Zn-ribbon protein involved in translation (DUF1610 family)
VPALILPGNQLLINFLHGTWFCEARFRKRSAGLPLRASLDKTCPKCGFTITQDLVKRVDFERMECPKCGEKFQI